MLLLFLKGGDALANRLKRECRKLGCLNLTDSKGGYCTEHSNETYLRYDRQRLSSKERGYNYRWTKYRSWFLRLHPICAKCGRAAASVVDHIVPHKGDDVLFWAADNHQALCKRCHDIKTSSEDGGFGNKISKK